LQDIKGNNLKYTIVPTKKITNTEEKKPKKAATAVKKEDVTIKKIENIDTDIVELKCIAEAMLEKRAKNVCSRHGNF